MLHIFEDMPNRPSCDLPQIISDGQAVEAPGSTGPHRVTSTRLMIDGGQTRVYVRTAILDPRASWGGS